MPNTGNTATNVTTGKPKPTGAIFVAPTGSTLPTTADGALDAAFTCLGYAANGGVTFSAGYATDSYKAWGGDTVYVYQTEKSETVQFSLIEAKNKDVLAFVHGDNNVTGDLANGITVMSKAEELDEKAVVIDMVLRGNVLKRYVIPAAKITELGDVVYQDSDVVAYQVTLACLADAAGVSHYEYLKEA